MLWLSAFDNIVKLRKQDERPNTQNTNYVNCKQIVLKLEEAISRSDDEINLMVQGNSRADNIMNYYNNQVEKYREMLKKTKYVLQYEELKQHNGRFVSLGSINRCIEDISKLRFSIVLQNILLISKVIIIVLGMTFLYITYGIHSGHFHYHKFSV